MLELNDVLIEGESHTLSLMAYERQITCVVGSARWLYAMMGFEPVTAGFISIDGEPLTPKTAQALRRQMAFAPRRLDDHLIVFIEHDPQRVKVVNLSHVPESDSDNLCHIHILDIMSYQCRQRGASPPHRLSPCAG